MTGTPHNETTVRPVYNWNMEFTDDNTGLIHVSNYEDEEEDYTYSEDEPSWTELVQDYYPSDESGKVFDTESGF